MWEKPGTHFQVSPLWSLRGLHIVLSTTMCDNTWEGKLTRGLAAMNFIGSHMDTWGPPDLSHSDSSPPLRAIKAFPRKLHS